MYAISFKLLKNVDGKKGFTAEIMNTILSGHMVPTFLFRIQSVFNYFISHSDRAFYNAQNLDAHGHCLSVPS